MISIPANLVKLISFLIRFYLLPLHTFLAILTGVFLFRGVTVEYYSSTLILFTCSLIIIFPFRFIRSQQILKIYLYLLVFATITLLLPTENTPGAVPVIPMIMFDKLALLLNLLFVYLYYRHRLNPKNSNPFLEKKTLIKVFGILGIIILIGVSTLLYTFYDPHYTDGKKDYITVPFDPPYARFNIFEKAFNKGYEIRQGILVNNKNLNLTITKKIEKNKNNQFIEIKEKDKSRLRVDFTKDNLINITFWDNQGTVHNSSTDNVAFQLNDDGDVTQIPISDVYYSKRTADMDSLYYIDYMSNIAYSTAPNSATYTSIRIDIQKKINYPKKQRYVPLWVLRTALPWSLTLIDTEGTIPLFDKINIWYN